MKKPSLGLVLLVVAGVWPWLVRVPVAFVNDASRAAIYGLVAVSLVLLTGWVGQISLAQASFVGIGAVTTAIASNRLGLGFPLNLPVAVLASAGSAILLGVVALRVRGLYLAVATLIFAWMVDAWLFPSPWFIGASGSASVTLERVGRKGAFPSFDLHNPRVLYLICAAGLALGMAAAANLRDSKTGRAFFAVQGSEMAAASLGMSVTNYKLLAFGLAGAMAGLAGHLQMVWQGSVVPTEFNFLKSLFYLSVAVVGGLASLPGAAAAGVLFAALNEVFYRVPALNGAVELVSALLLLGVLLAYPGGLAAGGQSAARRLGGLRIRIRQSLERRRAEVEGGGDLLDAPEPMGELEAGEQDVEAIPEPRPRPRWRFRLGFAAPTSTTLDGDGGSARPRRHDLGEPLFRGSSDGSGGVVPQSPPSPPPRSTPALPPAEFIGEDVPPRTWRSVSAHAPVVLEVEEVTVRFGGLVAVNSVSLTVREGQIVGLIGPNGAGKTTLFNAIAGFNDPAGGCIRLFGADVTRLSVHERAALGVGRTFQLIQLFPRLNVFENILVGTHLLNDTGFLQHMFLTGPALHAERACQQRAQEIIEVLGLTDVADRKVGELPFGVLRIVEFARALATGSPYLMMDEPASGLDNAETEQLAMLLRRVRDALGLSILLIEHDVPMVTGVSDYMYVIDRGSLLAEGSPAEIQDNPAVIAAYLGEPGAADAEEVLV